MEKEKALTMWLPVIAAGVKDLPECKEALEMAIEALENQRIGHWERKHNSYTLEHWYKCSECGDCSDYKTPYCQYCGAKMEEE